MSGWASKGVSPAHLAETSLGLKAREWPSTEAAPRPPGAKRDGSRGCTRSLAARARVRRSFPGVATPLPCSSAAVRITAGTPTFPSGLKEITFKPASSSKRKAIFSWRAGLSFTSDEGHKVRIAPDGRNSHRLPGAKSPERLPDFAGLLAHHRVPMFATEGVRKFRHVRERAVRTKPSERMRVGVGHQARVFEPFIGAPYLSPAQKETLLGVESVPVGRARLAHERFF